MTGRDASNIDSRWTIRKSWQGMFGKKAITETSAACGSISRVRTISASRVIRTSRLSLMANGARLDPVCGFGQCATQLRLEHLAVIVLGQRIDEAVVARALEAGDVVQAQPVERGGSDLGPGPGHDKGDDLLAPFGV